MIWGPLVKDQPGHTFGCDNENGGYQATKHLLDLGSARTIAFIGSTSRRSPEHDARHAGYVRALREEGKLADPDLKFSADNSEHQGERAANELLASGREFDCNIRGDRPGIAIGAMRALQGCRPQASPRGRQRRRL